jgi:hypothetical protein
MSNTGYAAAPVGPRRKIHPVVWVLIGLAGLCAVLLVAAAGVGYYVAERFEADPAGATTALLSAIDTGFEVVSTDKASGSLVLRDKNSGEITTLNLNELKHTSIDFGNGRGKIVVRDGEHDIVIGGGETPGWIPAYGNAKVKRTVSATTAGSQVFESSDAPSQVLAHYERELGGAGMRITRHSDSKLTAEGGGREVALAVEPKGSGSRVILSYKSKE